ncbi:MAG: hypothetical protein HWD58_12275 [Bacteroidota bacterium]|nr:MAG: hypothetical protein HWD58_12275 [Bacteroidota bacterium]
MQRMTAHPNIRSEEYLNLKYLGCKVFYAIHFVHLFTFRGCLSTRAQIWYEFKFNWTASSGIIPVQALMQQQAEDMAVLRMRYMIRDKSGLSGRS